MSKISLYFHTVKSLKPSQAYFRLRKMVGLKCSLRCRVREYGDTDVLTIPALAELDYDEEFIGRFPADEIMQDKITFLHSSRKFQWDEKWECQDQTELWNFNLHYFEYLYALIDAYKKTRDVACFEKTKQCIISWIQWNPVKNGGPGWSPYTIALRLTVWLEYYAEMQTEIKKDVEFFEKFLVSVYEQYAYLSNHLEKDLLGNHYFEDLKTLVLCALFFKDDQFLECVLKEFKSQCREQILDDGMHFELSPMYHKIIFEDMLRVAWSLRAAGRPDNEIEGYLQPMLDAAYSLEEGLERIPLFNDGGNNVSKSLKALMVTAEKYFHIIPQYKSQLPTSGYYIFKQDGWKLIVDAGQPGPAYIPGHAHCDAMSFELFRNGRPMVVNCGTYAYQCKERAFFRSTAAHNTLMVDGVEQSQCWGAFRLAKRAKVDVEKVGEDIILVSMKDQNESTVRRRIEFKHGLLNITDTAEGHSLRGYLHCREEMVCRFSGEVKKEKQEYAPEFGQAGNITATVYEDNNRLECVIKLDED